MDHGFTPFAGLGADGLDCRLLPAGFPLGSSDAAIDRPTVVSWNYAYESLEADIPQNSMGFVLVSSKEGQCSSSFVPNDARVALACKDRVTTGA